ncbi:MAG: methyltransferase [Algisphaera sp.]
MNNAALQFLGNFLRHPRQVGAVLPSSQALAQAMVAGLNLGPEQSLVEFGPGTGAFTQAILDHLPNPANYLGIELNAQFIARLRQRFPAASFAQGSAEDALTLHQKHNLPTAKAVVCGLPFASLPEAVQDGVTRSLDTLLENGGEFRTFQYVHAYHFPTAKKFRQRMDTLFGPSHRSPAIKMNMPPAYVVSWKR